MKLHNLIPKKSRHDDRWFVYKDKLVFKKFEKIPIAFISDEGIVYVYNDQRIRKECVWIIEHLDKYSYEFYLLPPSFSNPKISQSYADVIDHYLFTLTQYYFFKDIRKTKFNMIGNLINFCDKNDCYKDLSRLSKKYMKIIKNKTWNTSYTNQVYEYGDDIRNYFSNLDRKIKIEILNK